MPRGRKKKTPGIGAQLVSLQQQLLDNMSNRNDSTSANRNLSGYNIPEVMPKFQSIPGSTEDDEFFYLTTKFLHVRRNKKIWASINSIEKKYSCFNKTSRNEKTLNCNALNLFYCLVFIFVFLRIVT